MQRFYVELVVGKTVLGTKLLCEKTECPFESFFGYYFSKLYSNKTLEGHYNTANITNRILNQVNFGLGKNIVLYFTERFGINLAYMMICIMTPLKNNKCGNSNFLSFYCLCALHIFRKFEYPQ